MALIDDGPRSAAAVATKDSRVAAVNRRRFEFMVQETPFFALAVMQILADRLRRTDARVAAS
jgi:CRP-like cAMP-binding protein